MRSEFLKTLFDLSPSAPNMLYVNLGVIVLMDQNCATLANLLTYTYVLRSATVSHAQFVDVGAGMLSPRPGVSKKTGLDLDLGLMTVVASWPHPAWRRGLVVFEVLLKCFVTLTLKI